MRPEDWEAECRTDLDQSNIESVSLPPVILLRSVLLLATLFVFLVRLVDLSESLNILMRAKHSRTATRYEVRRREYLRV